MGEDERSAAPREGDSGAAVPLEAIPLHSTNLLTVLDGTGRVRYESPAIERIFGFAQDELVDEPVADYVHPDDRVAVMDAFQRVVESEEYTIEAVEYRHERSDGSYRWVESVASTNPTDDGYYVVNTRDVSDRRAREQELERTNERLDEFASVVSHDLMNPLNVAQGRLELAREECDSEQLDHAATAVDRSLALIDDLLTLAREGEHVSDLEAVALADAAAQCWQTVETADATLVADAERTIRADPSRLKQLLANLIRNAVEHGSTSSRLEADDAVEHGGEDVTVTVGDLESGFYVADDGPGIPEAERERVFEFGHSTKDGGTGFGLRIVRQIADAHGWECGVTESDRGGARFEFSGVASDA